MEVKKIERPAMSSKKTGLNKRQVELSVKDTSLQAIAKVKVRLSSSQSAVKNSSSERGSKVSHRVQSMSSCVNIYF